MTFVNFVRKLEGKPEISKIPEVEFPKVWDLALFKSICFESQFYSPGDTVEDYDFRDGVFDAFDWSSSHVPANLWDQQQEEGYMHPECHKALTLWRKAMEAGKMPEVTPV